MKNKIKNEKPMGIIRATHKTNKAPNHTFMVMADGIHLPLDFWVTALTSVDPTLNEYRVSYTDGVVRYFLLDEFIGTPFEFLIPQIKELTEKVNEADIAIIDGELYCKRN